MGNLHSHCHAVDQDDLVAPVELLGLARRVEQRAQSVRRADPCAFAQLVAYRRTVSQPHS